MPNTSVIIPALNEEQNIPLVLAAIPKDIHQVVVVDNGSTDNTTQVAADLGATVVPEPIRGYGQACLTGIKAAEKADILVFLDADFCDDPELIPQLIAPIINNQIDMVLGSRCLTPEAKKNLSPQQRWGNSLACVLMKWFWGGSYTDLGPFRAISTEALQQLNMQDRNFGWTVEMQVRALKKGLKVQEISVPYRLRQYGKSKISQTFSGVISAGSKILFVIGRELIRK